MTVLEPSGFFSARVTLHVLLYLLWTCPYSNFWPKYQSVLIFVSWDLVSHLWKNLSIKRWIINQVSQWEAFFSFTSHGAWQHFAFKGQKGHMSRVWQYLPFGRCDQSRVLLLSTIKLFDLQAEEMKQCVITAKIVAIVHI